MEEKENYTRISQAIQYLSNNFTNQPDLDEVAKQVHLSSFHFQRMFTDWAGVSPKKFLQFLTLDYAKKILQKPKATLFDAAIETGLSGTGRLHDLFINIEGMTPGEYKNGGENLKINYQFTQTPFGDIIIASTTKGVCFLSFSQSFQKAVEELKAKFPKATLFQCTDEIQQAALKIFSTDNSNLQKIKLHLKGTPFQLKVWEALLKIPFGKLSTYGAVAKNIQQQNASRAVGTAIGSNPVAYIIPCHRVIQSTGITGNYMWGEVRKKAIIGWEAAKSLPAEFN